MTIKLLFEASAIELSKIQAPTLKLYEFNYYANQAAHLFINKVYNIYDINQQTTDDLRVLKATATLKPTLAATTGNKAIDYLRGATYYVEMPDDYLHLLNCVCVYNVNKQKDCWNEGSVMAVGATKLTADSWSSIVDDVYNRPTKKRPYYYIHNQNDITTDNSSHALTDKNSLLPTNSDTDGLHEINYNGITVTEVSGFNRTFNYDSESQSAIEKPAGTRYSNASRVKVEIRCGHDKSNIFELAAVQIDYIKAPQYLRLTQEQLDSDEDISQVLEFPDYVNQEILNELVHLVMVRTNDPKISNHILMTLTIARPTGQLQQPAAQG